jgi:hypothetical protein
VREVHSKERINEVQRKETGWFRIYWNERKI